MTDQSPVQTQTSAATANGVLVLLEVRPGVAREEVMAVMPAEIRATVKLYLEGTIRDWHARGDGRGAVFLLNTGDVAAARAIMEDLPLARQHLVDEQYIPVGPLMPLGLLLGAQPAQP